MIKKLEMFSHLTVLISWAKVGASSWRTEKAKRNPLPIETISSWFLFSIGFITLDFISISASLNMNYELLEKNVAESNK